MAVRGKVGYRTHNMTTKIFDDGEGETKKRFLSKEKGDIPLSPLPLIQLLSLLLFFLFSLFSLLFSFFLFLSSFFSFLFFFFLFFSFLFFSFLFLFLEIVLTSEWTMSRKEIEPMGKREKGEKEKRRR